MKKIFIILLLTTNTIFVYSQIKDTLNTINPPPPSYFDNIVRYTPTGVQVIPCWELKSGYELTIPEKLAARAYCDSVYGDRPTFLGEATNTYNCHGYAWHMVENEINNEPYYEAVWLNYEVVYWSGNDESYEEVSWRENAKIRFQDDSDHSAIATDDEDIIISKWSNLPLYEHNIDDCPYYSDEGLKYYWIKKPVISNPPESLITNQTHTFSETRFVANNILGMTYY